LNTFPPGLLEFCFGLFVASIIRFPRSKGVKYLISIALCSSSCVAELYELGGAIGYGLYRNGSIYAAGGKAQAGIRNRFAAGAVFGDNLYEHISGEIRYLFHDGHPFLSSGGVKADIQGQSHTFTYELLFHFRQRERRIRPYLAAGVGAKVYVIAGPAPFPQPLAAIAQLVTEDEWKPVASLGGGIKFQLHRNIVIRGDFRDYLTTFPKRQIAPAPN